MSYNFVANNIHKKLYSRLISSEVHFLTETAILRCLELTGNGYAVHFGSLASA